MHHLSHLVAAAVLAALPLAAFAAALHLFLVRGERWRQAALAAATCWGVYLAISTELLSAMRWITRPAVAGAWLAAAIVAVAMALRFRNHRQKPASSEADRIAPSRVPLRGADWLLLGGIALILALVGITAMLAPPNTWDAMAYHMSRVIQWMTNRDVRPYPAFYSPQLFLSPWAEYAILHFDLLFASDRLANLVDWASMGGIALGVSLISERLGAGPRGQILAAAACVAMPAAILEASGAMNTCASAFWVVAAVYYALRWNQEQSWAMTLAIGATTSLAVLTKGTNYTFLPFLLLACWWIGPAHARRTQLTRLPILLLAVLVLNGPLYVRNYRLSGSPLGFSSPLGNDPERQYANARVSPSIAFANVVKNLALHIGTPVDAVNRASAAVIDRGLRAVGIDPSDTASTYRGGFHINPMSTYESIAGNPLELALIFAAIALLFSRRCSTREMRWLMAGVGCSFVLFCALIRWQAWNGRYQLPLFAVALAVAGAVFERIPRRALGTAVGMLLLLFGLPFALLNSLRPLAPWKPSSILRRGRSSLYFADYHQTLRDSYAAAAQAVLRSSCRNIGVDAALEDFDYPIFAMLGAGHGDRQVRYTGVRNLTAVYTRPEAGHPCVVICLRCANAPAKWAEYRDLGRANIYDEIAVFGSEGTRANQASFQPPDPGDVPALLAKIDRERDRLRSSGLGAIADRAMLAARDWPRQQVDLSGRIDSLYGETYAGWRIRDAAYPLRKNHTPEDAVAFDPLAVAAAAEVLENWNQTMPGKIAALSAHIDELYRSWQIMLQTAEPAPCTGVVTVQDARGGASGRGESRAIPLPNCACLTAKSTGSILARKPAGRYDREADDLSGCGLPAMLAGDPKP